VITSEYFLTAKSRCHFRREKYDTIRHFSPPDWLRERMGVGLFEAVSSPCPRWGILEVLG